MSNEENNTQILDGVTLSTFHPKEGETIFITVDTDKIDLYLAQSIFEVVKTAFPSFSIVLKLDGTTIESLMEDDLK